MGLPSRKRTHIPPGEKIPGCAKDMLVSWRAKIIYNKFHLEHAPDSSKTFVYEGKQFFKVLWGIFPKQSMYGIISLTFTIRNLPNVGKCTIHGWYGLGIFRRLSLSKSRSRDAYFAAHQGGSSNVPMVQPGPVLKVRRAGFFEQIVTSLPEKMGRPKKRSIPSRELTYPPKMAFWRWFSFSQGGIS